MADKKVLKWLDQLQGELDALKKKSGGGGGASEVKVETIYETHEGAGTGTYTLTKSIDNFDFLAIYIGVYSEYVSGPSGFRITDSPCFISVKDLKEFYAENLYVAICGWSNRSSFVAFNNDQMYNVRNEQSQVILKVNGIKLN